MKARVPDVGFQQLIARLATEVDPSLVATGPKPVKQRVTDEITNPDGTTDIRQRYLTPTEQREFAEMSNEYLRDAGVDEVPAEEDLFLTPCGMAYR
ncbi:DUF5956 family protein [Microbacterium alkaliflavum]